MAVTVIIGLLSVILIAFTGLLSKDAANNFDSDKANPFTAYVIGLVTNFLDTLGIGSFAPTTAALKFTKQIDERLLPGTLNVAYSAPVLVQAIIFIKAIDVDIFTLAVLIIASVIGAYLGAGIVSKLPRRAVKLVMGIALIIIAIMLILGQTGVIDGLGTGTAIGLYGARLWIVAGIFFVLGALMSAGVGLYAPAMAVVFMSGMAPGVAFPIMMGACAFLMPVGSTKFIKEKAYAPKLSLFLTLGAILGVIFATQVVTSLPMKVLTWLVIIVVLVTGAIMIYEGITMRDDVAPSDVTL